MVKFRPSSHGSQARDGLAASAQVQRMRGGVKRRFKSLWFNVLCVKSNRMWRVQRCLSHEVWHRPLAMSVIFGAFDWAHAQRAGLDIIQFSQARLSVSSMYC